MPMPKKHGGDAIATPPGAKPCLVALKASDGLSLPFPSRLAAPRECTSPKTMLPPPLHDAQDVRYVPNPLSQWKDGDPQSLRGSTQTLADKWLTRYVRYQSEDLQNIPERE